MTDRGMSDLTPPEQEEFDRLYSAASAEAIRQMVVFVDPRITGIPMRQFLQMLRDGTWRRRLSTWH
jgi:hypothetical protein